MIFDFDKEFQNMMQKHSLNTVILLGHLNPDGDAAGSVMGLAHYIKVNYPQYRVIFRTWRILWTKVRRNK